MFQNKFLKNYFISKVCQIYLLNHKIVFIFKNRNLFQDQLTNMIENFHLYILDKIFENKTKIKIIQELGIVSFKFV